jgi:hypothetical protein
VDWSKFDTPLQRKPGLVIDDAPNEFGMVLRRVKPAKVAKPPKVSRPT